MPLPKSVIRKLAWDYYLGKVEPIDEYRRRRRLLVDACISGEPIPEFDNSAPANLDLELDADSGAATLIPDSSTVEKSAPTKQTAPLSTPPDRRPMIFGALAALILLIVAGAFYLADDDQLEPQIALAEPVLRKTPSIPESLQSAIQALEANGWNDQAASLFLSEWTAISPANRDTLRQSQSLSAITEIVARHASEQVTLASAGVDISPETQENIDLLLASLSLPLARWPEPSVQLAQTTETTVAATDKTQPPAPEQIPASTEPALNDLPTTETVDNILEDDEISSPDNANIIAEPDLVAPVELPTAAPISSEAETSPTPAKVEPPVKKAPRSTRPAAIVLSERSGCSAELVNSRVRTCRDFLSSKVRAPKMAVLPPGNFIMGDAQRPSESPQVEVNISTPLAFSTHEISFREFQIYCKNSGATCPANPGNSKQLPVVGITWQEAADYAAWLSERTGKHYRLPSEAEWEYAARAGSSTTYPFGDNLMVTQARFSTRSREASAPLENTYQAINPNAFQLYHMVGNVREWVADGWQDHHDSQISTGSPRAGNSMRVVRGGSFADDADQLRSAARQPLDGTSRDRFTGFRIVLDFSAKAS